jgi:hypothetical protein
VSALATVSAPSVLPTTIITPSATINGIKIPIYEFDCQTGAYGSVGRFTFKTAISALASTGFGPPQSNQGLSVVNFPSSLSMQSPFGGGTITGSSAAPAALLSQYVATAQPSMADGSPSLPVQILVNGAYGQPVQPIFGGDLDAMTWDFDKDELTVEGRDFSGRLRDWKPVFDASVSHMTPTQLATRVAKKMNLTINIPTQLPTEASVGSLLYEVGVAAVPGIVNPLGGSGVMPTFWSRPQEVWALLNLLARAVGWDVHTTYDGTLYFGPPQYTGTVPKIFTYRAPPGTNVVPIRNLQVLHQPHRYGTFKVIIRSYHGPTLVNSTATAVHVGAPFTTPTAKLVMAGVYTNAASLSSEIEDGKPNYIYYIPNILLPQLTQLSMAATFDLAKRLYIVEGQIDGDPTILPQMPVQLNEGVVGCLQGYADIPLHLVSVNHVYSMSEGYLTHIKAWYAPPGPLEYGVTPQTSFGVD